MRLKRQKRKQNSARQRLGHLVVGRRTTSEVDSGDRRLGKWASTNTKLAFLDCTQIFKTQAYLEISGISDPDEVNHF